MVNNLVNVLPDSRLVAGQHAVLDQGIRVCGLLTSAHNVPDDAEDLVGELLQHVVEAVDG